MDGREAETSLPTHDGWFSARGQGRTAFFFRPHSESRRSLIRLYWLGVLAETIETADSRRDAGVVEGAIFSDSFRLDVSQSAVVRDRAFARCLDQFWDCASQHFPRGLKPSQRI